MEGYEAAKNRLSSLLNFATYDLDPRVQVVAAVKEEAGGMQVELATNSASEELVLHWGVGLKKKTDWVCPSTMVGLRIPTETKQFDDKASQTPFARADSYGSILMYFPEDSLPRQLNFVFKDGNSWYNNQNRNYALTVYAPPAGNDGITEDVKEFVENILECEAEHVTAM